MLNFNPNDFFSFQKPDFFSQPYIQNIQSLKIFDEMILDLKSFSKDSLKLYTPPEIKFRLFSKKDSFEELLTSVSKVVPHWVDFFKKDSIENIYCAFSNEQIVSFCLLEEFKYFSGQKIAGPGCVGTTPEFRRKNIGLKLVQNATSILKERNFDLSYIHWTGVPYWYAKLGYKTFLRWNKNGILEI